ncbi:hypothetical protein OROHE_024750 [Orobanche hederae]
MAPKIAKGMGPAVDPMEEIHNQPFALNQAVETLEIQQECWAANQLQRRHNLRSRSERFNRRINPTFETDGFSNSDEEDTVFMVNPLHRACNTPPATGGGSRWDQGFLIEILEFSWALDPVDFLDWIHTVDDILEFKQVPDDRRVASSRPSST